MLSETSQSQKNKYDIVKFRETTSSTEVVRGWVSKKWGVTVYWAQRLFPKTKSSQNWLQNNVNILNTTNLTLKTVNIVNFVMCILQLKNVFNKKCIMTKWP